MYSIELLAGLLSVLVGGLLPLSKKLVGTFIRQELKRGTKKESLQLLAKVFGIEIEEQTAYKKRLANTLDILKKAFAEVDKATSEFTALMKEKEQTIDLLEKRLSELSTEEAKLVNKVETLQKVPIEALTHFEEMLNQGDKRSAFRDYLLFGCGVVVSIVVTVILKIFFNI